MRFEFATATRIVFGPGTLREAGPMARQFGKRALVVTGKETARAAPLLDILRENGVASEVYGVDGEPSTATVGEGVAIARQQDCDLVISNGGGSAIDAGKAIAAMLANQGELLDYLEVVGRGGALTQPSVPFIAIPTTAGTGSEVTRNAVLLSPAHHVKVSLRSPYMLPTLALVDPLLTLNLPPIVTAATGLDALTQVIEPYVCARPNPMTDAVCVEAIPRVARSLRKAFLNGGDAAAREDMSAAALFGGLALANAGLGAVHGFAGPIGGMFPAPHGAVCATLLPHVISANVKALLERQPASDVLNRYRHVARLLTGNPAAEPAAAVTWVKDLLRDLEIPALAHYGISSANIPDIVEKAAQASSMKANPITLTLVELSQVLQSAL